MDLLNTLLETCTTLTRKVDNLEQDKIAQALEITKLKQRVRKLKKKRKLKVLGLKRLKKQGGCNQTGRNIAELDADEDVTLEEVDAEVAKDAEYDEAEPAELKEVIEVVTTAKLMTKIVTAAATIITAAPSAARRRKGIEQDEAYARELEAELNANINWNEVIEQHFNSIVAFLKKGKKELEKEANKAIKSPSETSKEKAAKNQKLDEEAKELKTHLQIIPNDEDDVYTEATPLALKVPVVDYQIHTKNNKPHYKIIRADGTHQLILSLISLLRNFDREDLQMLRKIVQERFASLEPNNFSDDFLLNILKSMFEKPNVEAHI
uniref:Uncharacterized protein n=1 Tax=Tanacetum cinerariifolium TaxID=118510 RepID=A0A6L2NC82_TANCI|nr:hypothetical protein [Tanacetum cinerariifolium]